jgi:hypothetical protein
MEVAAVLNILNFSLLTNGICYTKHLGVEVSKAYKRVVSEKPYRPNISITRLECRGHVQKVVGARMRRLVKEKMCTNLHDAKFLGGKSPHRKYGAQITKWLSFSHQNGYQQGGSVWAIFFTNCQQMRNSSIVFVQVVMTVAVNTRTLPVQDLHINTSVVY